MKRCVLAAAVLWACLAGAVRGSAPTAAGSVPAAASAPATRAATRSAAPDQARWEAIVKQLGADDFAQRDAAQKDLDQMTWRQMDFLRRAAEEATDPEVKARLTARVAAIEEEVAVNPPPLTLELKDATTSDVADAFSKALGIKLDIWPPAGNGENYLFTLSAKDKPFWEVFMELSRQHGMTLQDGGNGQMRLMVQSGQSWRNGVICGPVAIFPQSISRQRSANLQAEKGQELNVESTSLYCQVVVDPRVRLVKYSNPIFTSVIDDAGNMLYQQAGNPVSLWDVNGRTLNQGTSISLQMPEKKGTRIVSAKGTVRFAVQTAEEHMEVDDVEKKVGQSFDIAGVSAHLTRFNVQGDANNTNINLGLETVRGPAGNPGAFVNGLNGNFPLIGLTLVDSTGKTAFTNTLRGNMSAGIGGSYTGPYKLRLAVATKTKEVTEPFELKDLPLP